jgi:hypothetical protein
MTVDNNDEATTFHYIISTLHILIPDVVVTMDIKDYPITIDTAQNALHALANTHIMQLMQASDVDGKLIMPNEYMDTLLYLVHVRGFGLPWKSFLSAMTATGREILS